MECNKIRPPVSHVAVYVPCSKKKYAIYSPRKIFGVLLYVAWKRQVQLYYIIPVRIAAVSRGHVLVRITQSDTARN